MLRSSAVNDSSGEILGGGMKSPWMASVSEISTSPTGDTSASTPVSLGACTNGSAARCTPVAAGCMVLGSYLAATVGNRSDTDDTNRSTVAGFSAPILPSQAALSSLWR
jgi:hypothetical protein